MVMSSTVNVTGVRYRCKSVVCEKIIKEVETKLLGNNATIKKESEARSRFRSVDW